ncbi:glycosyltransferase [Aeoliella sp. SH292]|uniref:glycosyltransferase n=1 Tax=Aeoliella sp. SH292 TaxID=3454464 RepID=UPI003F99DB53
MPDSTIRTAPLRTLFLVTSMPVGGAETLLVNLVRRLDRDRVVPEICCLKERGPLGEMLAGEIPVHAEFIEKKSDFRVVGRLARLMRDRKIDAVVTVGAGDKMFWGRIAAWWAGVPVVCSALHSTGWPDGVGRLNRLLTPITDAFIGVAERHGRFLVECERFPQTKVAVIPNGVDTDRFAPGIDVEQLRHELGIPHAAPVAVIVAALRPEKNHELFLEVALRVTRQVPEARFLVVGDGPERERLETRARQLSLADCLTFLGTRSDIPALLNVADVNVLTSDNEANPVSILEAMSCATPTVATNVGSVSESVLEGHTGYVAPPGDADRLAGWVVELMNNPLRRERMGSAARQMVVERWSLDAMVHGYEDLIAGLYEKKTGVVLDFPERLPEIANTLEVAAKPEPEPEMEALEPALA